jgi:hypothetical protein
MRDKGLDAAGIAKTVYEAVKGRVVTEKRDS